MNFDWDFDAGRDGFVYRDDAFRGAAQPGYASGGWTDGASGGGLTVRLGGRDGADIAGMSGGWTRSFTLEEAQTVSLTLTFRMTQTAAYEAREYTEALLALDGVLKGIGGRDYLGRIAGDGNGGPGRSTGWQTVTIDLGELSEGAHNLTFGGHNNLKTDRNESSTIQFDDILLTGAATPDDGTDGPPPGVDAFEMRVIELTNAFRVENGRAPLEIDARLNAAAEGWSREMADGDFFRHSDTAGLLADQGYAMRALGENIAAGQQTPDAVVNAWISSSGHRANMLRTGFEDIGVGHVHLPEDPGGLRYKHYWTQIFATEADTIA
jgi:uncharacterized protein YkwD